MTKVEYHFSHVINIYVEGHLPAIRSDWAGIWTRWLGSHPCSFHCLSLPLCPEVLSSFKALPPPGGLVGLLPQWGLDHLTTASILCSSQSLYLWEPPAGAVGSFPHPTGWSLPTPHPLWHHPDGTKSKTQSSHTQEEILLTWMPLILLLHITLLSLDSWLPRPQVSRYFIVE